MVGESVMKPDEVNAIGTGHRYSWNGSHGIVLEINRLREARGRIDAEVRVSCVSGHVYHGLINLLKHRDRKEVINACIKKQCDVNWEDFPFDSAFEEACLDALSQYRQGEPVVEVGNKPISSKSKHLLYPFLVENQANLIYGPGGTCKSFLSGFICLLLESGESRCKLNPNQITRTLYLDFETSREEINDRVQMLKSGLNLPKDTIPLYRFCHQPLAADIAEIQRLVSKDNVGFVIVDSYGMACGGDAWSQQVARDYFMSLRSLRVPTLTIDHVAKENAKGPFGSVYKYNEARNIFEIKATQELGEDATEIGLFHRKANNGRLLKPLGYRFSFIDDEAVIVESIDVKENGVLASELPLKDKIVALLRSGPMKAPDIATELDVKESSVRGTLNRYKDKIFAKLMDNVWGISTNYYS